METINNILLELENLIDKENYMEVEKILSDILKRDDFEPGQWMYIGKLCEEIGEINKALHCYSMVLKNDYFNKDALLKKAYIFLERNNLQEAIDYFKKVLKIDNSNTDALLELGKIYDDLNEYGFAKELYGKYLSLIADDKEVRQSYERINLDFKNKSENYLEIPDEDINYIKDLFSAREGVYAKQWLSNDGSTGYMPVYNENFDVNVLKKHLIGIETIGLYPVKKNNTVSWAAIDLDASKKVLTKLDKKNNQLNDLLTTAAQISNLCLKNNINTYIEFSGHKGYHLWFFFEENIEAKKARGFLIHLINLSDIKKENINYEIFPKQDKVDIDKVGNLIKMPLGLHKRTLNRSVFIDEQGNEYKNQIEFIKTVKRIKTQDIENFMQIRKSTAIDPPAQTTTPGAASQNQTDTYDDQLAVLRLIGKLKLTENNDKIQWSIDI